MNADEIKAVLEKHRKWIIGESGGKRAYLRGANLSGADLSGADLRDADLSGANLIGANLIGANLIGADLRDADLRGANLRGANLRGADLRDANLIGANLIGADLRDANLIGANLIGADLRDADLRGANLRGADLSGADLSGANLRDANLRDANLIGAKNLDPLSMERTRICPTEGEFVAWKKCVEGISKVLVLADAERSNSTGRKCRASKVITLELPKGCDIGHSMYDEATIYRVGQVTECDKWNPDRWVECCGGIHFYMTKAEAEAH